MPSGFKNLKRKWRDENGLEGASEIRRKHPEVHEVRAP